MTLNILTSIFQNICKRKNILILRNAISINMSQSEDLRRQGNKKFIESRMYQQKTSEDVNKRIGCLEEAVSLYDKAMAADGSSAGEKASAAKNCAKSYSDMTDAIRLRYAMNKYDPQRSSSDDYHIEMIQLYMMNLNSYQEALMSGQQVKSKDWNEELLQSMGGSINSTLPFIEKVNASIPGLPSCLYNLVLCQINLGLLLLETDQYDKGYAMLSECNRPMAVLEKTSCTTYDTLSRQLADTLSRAEAWKMFHRGKNMFSKMIDDDELNVEYMDDAIDSFHAAINRMNDKDLKLEAMAYSYLGQLYYQTVHNVKKSAEYLQNCIAFVDMLPMANHETLLWYRKCVETMTLIKDIESECKENEEKSGDILTPKEARTKYDDDMKFIQYIYQKYPPKNTKKPIAMPTTETLMEMNPNQLRRFVTRINFAYHPDKIRDDSNIMWKNTCHEICVGLNAILEKIKRGV